jgi:glucose-6-phosphate 1-epimerase
MAGIVAHGWSRLARMERLPDGARIETGPGGLERLALSAAAGEAHVFLHGGHVTHFQPRGGEPVVWVSRESRYESGKPIRGGVPICFPWFGAHPSDPARPPHGLARLSSWTLDGVAGDADGAVVVNLALRTEADPAARWPHRWELSYRATFGRELVLELRVRNAGESACVFQEALHTYFSVGDIRQVTVDGLAGAAFVDKVRGGERSIQEAAPLHFAGETDRVYLGTEAATAIVDPVLGRRIVIEKQGSRTTVVWNPWIAKARAMPDFGDDEWPAMVCVETANALDDAVTVRPGESQRLQARIRLEPLPG